MFELAGSAWMLRSEFEEGSSNTNLIARNGDKVYVYQRPGALSKLLEYNAEGACVRVVDVSVPSRDILAGSFVFSEGRLYLALLDGSAKLLRFFQQMRQILILGRSLATTCANRRFRCLRGPSMIC